MKKEGGGEGEEVKIGKEEIGRRRWEGWEKKRKKGPWIWIWIRICIWFPTQLALVFFLFLLLISFNCNLLSFGPLFLAFSDNLAYNCSQIYAAEIPVTKWRVFKPWIREEFRKSWSFRGLLCAASVTRAPTLVACAPLVLGSKSSLLVIHPRRAISEPSNLNTFGSFVRLFLNCTVCQGFGYLPTPFPREFSLSDLSCESYY